MIVDYYFAVIVLIVVICVCCGAMDIQKVIDEADIISLAVLAGLIMWVMIFFVQVSAAVMYSVDPVSSLVAVWELHKELIILIFVAYGVIKKPA